MAPHTPQRSEAPRGTRGAPRSRLLRQAPSLASRLFRPRASADIHVTPWADPPATLTSRRHPPKTVPFGPDSFYQLLVGDEAGSTPVRVGIQTAEPGYAATAQGYPPAER
jgi:hypothetical protein